jgi:RNA polymerase sigma factor (sigma-70 family)
VNDQTDQQLLRDYTEHLSETAFAAIVQRYVDLVYSAALRMVCDTHAAQDVTQRVFILLAEHAAQLTNRVSLAGWLHCSARNLAVKAVRSDVRRRAREQEAAVMNKILSTDSDASWDHIAPYLDDALAELSEPDREALLLRYFKNQDLRTVGATLGISDDAAQKRVSRAVERLREFFAKRGVTVGASGLVVVLSANAVQAAPVGLALTISTAAALTGTTLATTATVTATKTIAMTALQKTIVTATIAVLAGAGIYEARQASRLREQVQTLQQQQEPLTAQIQQLQSERDDAANRQAWQTDELANAKKNNLDLLKLRSEVGLLRNQTNQLGSLQKEAARTPTESANEASENELVTRAQYEFAGFAEPKSTVNSMFWAMSQGDIQTVLASMSPALQSQTREQWKGIADDELKAGLLSDADNRKVTGYRITNKLVVSDNEVVLTIFQEGRDREKKMRLVRVGDEWKFAGTPGM